MKEQILKYPEASCAIVLCGGNASEGQSSLRQLSRILEGFCCTVAVNFLEQVKGKKRKRYSSAGDLLGECSSEVEVLLYN